MQTQSLFHLEHKVRKDAIALVECGFRPKALRLIIGNALSMPDLVYLFKIETPLAPNERHGRVRFVHSTDVSPSKSSSFRDMHPQTVLFCQDTIVLINSAISLGATRADAIAAAWRIQAGRYGTPIHHRIAGINAEDIGLVWLTFMADQVSVNKCKPCGANFFHNKVTSQCPACLTAKRALTRLAA